jgi:hypothetical protein
MDERSNIIFEDRFTISVRWQVYDMVSGRDKDAWRGSAGKDCGAGTDMIVYCYCYCSCACGSQP